MAMGYAALLDNEPEFARTMAASVKQRIAFDVPQPIWEVFSTTEDIPDEEWEKLPTDLATQH
jgi:hypothetical protein